MNGWLVLLRCTCDDIPVMLTDDLDAARDFVRDATPESVAAHPSLRFFPHFGESFALTTFRFVNGVLDAEDVVGKKDMIVEWDEHPGIG